MHQTIDRYLRCRQGRGEIGPGTFEATRYTLRHWVRQAGPDPKAWSEADVVAWCGPHLALRANTRKARLSRLRVFLRWLVAEGLLGRDPSVDVVAPRPPAGDPRDLAAEDVARLLSVCPDERAVVIVMLMVQCGLRCSDVARVQVEDIDVRRRILSVRAKGGGGERTHTVPIPGEAWSVLVPWVRSLKRSSGPLVTSKLDPSSGIQGHSISKLLRGWLADAGVKVLPWDGCSAHALRHTCAQDMLDHGADIRDVQFALGHRSIRTTEIYLRREPPGLREAMEGRSYLPAAA